ncbi:Retrovirus-related Pol polyprotein from transposon RE1 [Araneus ventricosus]|uniref:Retrovirus-related Pol polyprotein from transposon RE1 n=1 Tax=Araneus ventricosus TaxID=182803 RepID=A0A4Y2SFH1_ARAVE|nr:Retrovirus-related Pol polyprotein from transposon RE1 [Araneus ventricosus]
MPESSPFAFPKLDGSNYTSWKEDMKVVLMDRGCWSFIIGEDKPCPEQATAKEKFELKDEEFNHREVEKQLVNEAGRIQLKKKDLNLDFTENASPFGSFRQQETRKKFFERSGAVLDPSRNPGQYRKIDYPKGMGPFCDFCSRKEHTASKCHKKRNKEKKQAFASETAFCGVNKAFGVSKDWYQFLIDIAATSHFCYERDWFKNFQELTTTKALLADKKSTCEVKGIGDIDFVVKDIKDQNLNNDSDFRAQDEKSSSPETPSTLDISAWIRLEKPRKKSKRIDVYYYPPSKERLRPINDVKIYCERNKLEFDPNQFNFKPTTNTRFEKKKTECDNETSSDSVDVASLVNDIFQHEIYMTEIPKTYNETQISPDKEKWNEAMSEEIKLMQNRKVWDLVEPKSNMKVLDCRWVYNIKHDEKNNVKKYKSRLVAQGFKQRPGVDFTDVFAPLVNFYIIKFLFVLLVCILRWNHAQIDVKGTHLYGNLDVPIYMQQPEGFVVKECEHYVFRLHNLYMVFTRVVDNGILN